MSGGWMCPYCSKYTSRTIKGKKYTHKGTALRLVGSGFMECRASGLTWDEAKELRSRVDSGESPRRVLLEMNRFNR